MIRKITQKADKRQQKQGGVDLKLGQNEYYLLPPNAKAYRTATKQTQSNDKQKLSLKYSRKTSHTAFLAGHSIPHFKPDSPNQSKQLFSHHSKQLNARLRTETLKMRSNSHIPSFKSTHSKSSLKLQLPNAKSNGIKRINLKLESPAKHQQKGEQRQQNFDSYYNKDGTIHLRESKTIRNKNGNKDNSNNGEWSLIYNRCHQLIEDYQQKLEVAKRLNQQLMRENQRLRGQKSKGRD